MHDVDILPPFDSTFVIRPAAAGLREDQLPSRILLLYGSLRERSFSRLAIEEAAQLLQLLRAESSFSGPADLPVPARVAEDDHPAVHELREHAIWSDRMVCAARRGKITGIMEA